MTLEWSVWNVKSFCCAEQSAFPAVLKKGKNLIVIFAGHLPAPKINAQWDIKSKQEKNQESIVTVIFVMLLQV